MPRSRKFPTTEIFKAKGWTALPVNEVMDLRGTELRGSLCTDEERRECDRKWCCPIAETREQERTHYKACHKIKVSITRIVDVKLLKEEL